MRFSILLQAQLNIKSYGSHLKNKSYTPSHCQRPILTSQLHFTFKTLAQRNNINRGCLNSREVCRRNWIGRKDYETKLQIQSLIFHGVSQRYWWLMGVIYEIAGNKGMELKTEDRMSNIDLEVICMTVKTKEADRKKTNKTTPQSTLRPSP